MPLCKVAQRWDIVARMIWKARDLHGPGFPDEVAAGGTASTNPSAYGMVVGDSILGSTNIIRTSTQATVDPGVVHRIRGAIRSVQGDEPAKDAFVADSGAAVTDAATFGGDDFGGADAGGGDDRACRICNETGHFARECPQKPEGFGKCFNCGQEGHNKAECTNPRVFSGTCRVCQKEGHAARDCPDKPAPVCRNCKQEGHVTSECSNNMVFDPEEVAELPVEEAWKELVKTAKEAAENRDLDDFRTAVKVYKKAVGQVTYGELERSFRSNDIGIYLIATASTATEPLPGLLLDTHTLVNLAGKRDCSFQVGYFFKKTPRTAKLAAVWPTSEAENMERLKDAGIPYERGIPKCLRCKEMGHTTKNCPEEPAELGQQSAVKCFNCEEEGHRVRDCPKPRVDHFACRNCNQPGHTAAECTEPRSAEGVECKRCHQVGHFAKECPNSSGGQACRNCGEEGHMAKECEKPKNPAMTKCRNCEEMGHFSKDCPQPKDWSKVKLGHTFKRCPQAKADAAAAAVADNTGNDNGGFNTAAAASGDWEDANGAGANEADAGAPAVTGGWEDTDPTPATTGVTASGGGW
ncbi:MAG: hypothetical protein Q9212_004397 [Teloschistes hypoglaucus]